MAKKQKKKKTIGTKIIPALILAILIPVMGALFFTYHSTTNLLKQRIEAQEKEAVSGIVRMFEEIKSEAEQTLDTIAANSIMNGEEGLQNFETYNQAANMVLESSQYLYNIYLYQPGQPFRGTTGDTGQLIDVESRDWYEGAVEQNGEPHWGSPYADTITGASTMTVSKEVEQADGSVGVLGVDLDFTKINEAVSSTQFGQTGSVFVFSGDGFAQMASDESIIGEDISTNTLFTQATQDSGVIFDKLNNESFGIYYEKIDGLDMIVYGHVQEDELQQELAAFMKTGGAVTIGGAILAVLIAWFLTKYLSTITHAIEQAFEKVRNGDLSTRLKGKDLFLLSKGNRFKKKAELDPNGNEIHQIALSFNDTIETFEDTVGAIQANSYMVADMSFTLTDIANQTTSATEEVSETITGIAQATSTQTQDTEATSDKMALLSDSVKEIEKRMEEMGLHSDETMMASGRSSFNMDQVNTNWQETIQTLEGLRNSIEAVDSNIQNIEGIIHVIQGISDQTNLLALNASIEAARAGDAGRGFGVVAEEIRKLAEQSNHSSADINEIIRNIQEKSTDMVQTLKNTFEGSEKQTGFVQEAIASNQEVVEKVEKLTESIYYASQSSSEVNARRDEMAMAIENIAASAQENSAGTEEVSANAEEILATMEEFSSHISELKQVADDLKESTGHFKIQQRENSELSVTEEELEAGLALVIPAESAE